MNGKRAASGSATGILRGARTPRGGRRCGIPPETRNEVKRKLGVPAPKGPFGGPGGQNEILVAIHAPSSYNPAPIPRRVRFRGTPRNFPSGERAPMTVKKSTLALATALAACFVGCEWTGTDESFSWSSAYDAMNFSGTYRAVTTATSISPSNTNSTDTIHTEPGESRWTFPKDSNVISGRASHGNIVPKSFSIDAGNDYVWNDDGDGHLVFTSRENGTPDDSGEYEYTKAPSFSTSTGDAEVRSWQIHLPHANVKDVSVSYGGVSLSVLEDRLFPSVCLLTKNPQHVPILE